MFASDSKNEEGKMMKNDDLAYQQYGISVSIMSCKESIRQLEETVYCFEFTVAMNS